MNNERQVYNRIKGSIMGGAIGDALGYPVEFVPSFEEIQHKYGERGITSLDTTWKSRSSYQSATLGASESLGNKAVVSDDTQMTLFTALGLVNAERKHMSYLDCIREAYLEWLLTQTACPQTNCQCWIAELPALNRRRAPGMTCMEALANILYKKEVYNDSKGCGGVMRIAPIPLFFLTHHPEMPIEDVDRLAADASAITHLHPLGYIPSAFLSHIIYRIVENQSPSKQNYITYIQEGLNAMDTLYPQHQEYVEQLRLLINKAVAFAATSDDAVTIIEQHLGGGWVAEETVAIAVYCSLKYFDNFEEALIASVNHGGDSDSTGAVTGNILGAVIGYDQLPQHFKDDVELHDVILKVVDELGNEK